MKLDSIIYDTNTLANAITEKLVDESPTFKAMYPSETSTALVNLLAGYGSMLQYTMVSAMANCYTETAFSPTAIYQLAETLGNRLHGNVSSVLYCTLERKNLLGLSNVVIPKHSTFDAEGVQFINEEDIVFSRNINTIQNVKLIQGAYIIVDNVTSGIAGEKIYFSEDFLCNMNTVKVYINGERWSVVDSFLPLNTAMIANPDVAKAVVLKMRSDGRAYIKFGNNSNGIVPTSGSSVRIEYVSNGGKDGNIEKSNIDIQLTTPLYFVENSVNTLLDIEVTSSQVASGGYNTQSLEVLKESSPYVFASGDRAVRRDDYKAILLNKCGYISANVWGEYEEAKHQGGYDKIMMNTVYYTGIREVQNYDYRSMGSIDIPNSEEGINPNNPIYFSKNLSNVKGFPGSYEIYISYVLDDSQFIRYSDKTGYGILVCDPSDNGEWDGEPNLYPYNDAPDVIGYSGQRISCLQGTQPGHDVDKLITGENDGFKSNGSASVSTRIPMKISFDNPLQIQILLPSNDPKALSMFSFQTPHNYDDVKHFPGLVAVYATNNLDTADPTMTVNIKNNSEWVRIADVQMLTIPEQGDAWCNWITTNLFTNANRTEESTTEDGWVTYPRYMIEIYSLHDESVNVWGDADADNPDLNKGACFIQKMKLMLNKKTSSRYAWGQQDQYYYTKSELPTPATGTAPNYIGGDDVYDSNLQKKVNYKIITSSDSSITIYDQSAEQEVGVFNRNTEFDMSNVEDHRTSTIQYENNSLVDLCIPELKEQMNYYYYNIDVSGLTAANGYLTNDILCYPLNSGEYINVRVINIDNGQYAVCINPTRGVIADADKKQKGNTQLILNNVPLEYVHGDTGSGATVTVSTESAISAYGDFVGNAYTTTSAQENDYPIINKYNHFTTYVEFKQPKAKNVQIHATIEYKNSSVYKDARKKVEEEIRKLFEITPFYIGQSLDVSKVWDAINSVDGVKRFVVTYPINNIDCEPYEFINLPYGNLVITDKINEDF